MEVQREMHFESQVGPVTGEPCETICTPTLNSHDYFSSGAPEMSTEEMLEAAQKRIEDLEAMLEKQTLFGRLQMKPDKCIKSYTGFPSFEVLVTTFRTLRPTS